MSTDKLSYREKVTVASDVSLLALGLGLATSINMNLMVFAGLR